MQHGTLNFYSTSASLIPLILLTYVFTLRSFEAYVKFREASPFAGPVTPADGCVWIVIPLAPIAAVVFAVIGEISCLSALFTGRPNSATQDWTIGALVVLAGAIVIHLLALLITRYNKRQMERYLEREKRESADNQKGEEETKD